MFATLFTPMSRMTYRALLRKGRVWLEEEAAKINVTEDAIWEAFMDYAMISCRIQNVNGAFDFTLGTTSQKPEEVRKHFRKYLATKNMVQLQQAEALIRELDTPDDEDATVEFDGDDNPNV